jgi:hypothetical protein
MHTCDSCGEHLERDVVEIMPARVRVLHSRGLTYAEHTNQKPQYFCVECMCANIVHVLQTQAAMEIAQVDGMELEDALEMIEYNEMIDSSGVEDSVLSDTRNFAPKFCHVCGIPMLNNEDILVVRRGELHPNTDVFYQEPPLPQYSGDTYICSECKEFFEM